MNINIYKDIYRRFGFLAMLHDLVISAIDKVIRFRCLVVYLLDEPGEKKSTSGDVSVRVMSRNELREFEVCPEMQLPRLFMDEAYAAGDVCIGGFVDGEFCGYSWYSEKDSPSSVGLTTSFLGDYVYTYKNFTLPQFRGLGMQVAIKEFALNFYKSKGKKGIVLAVESQNFASRRSTVDAGGRVVGYWMYLLKNKFYWGWGTKGCDVVGYRYFPAWQLSFLLLVAWVEV